MPRSDEAEAWFHAVYSAVQEIPHGKVTSYGHIARLIGRREYSVKGKRTILLNHTYSGKTKVGVCLKHLPDGSTQPDAVYNSNTVPWQRVINSKGSISPRGPNGASRQATALRAEGVTVERSAMGELSVNLGDYGWFPTMLPSEEAEIESSEDEDNPS